MGVRILEYNTWYIIFALLVVQYEVATSVSILPWGGPVGVAVGVAVGARGRPQWAWARGRGRGRVCCCCC